MGAIETRDILMDEEIDMYAMEERDTNRPVVYLPLEELIFWPGRTVWIGLLTGEQVRELSGSGYARRTVVCSRDPNGHVHLSDCTASK